MSDQIVKMASSPVKVLLFILAVAGGLIQSEGRRESLIVRVEVPSAVRVGDSVVLKCLYDLGGESLYTMKWYRGDNEFYRFTPKEMPPVKTFPFPGISIDLSHSNATHLTLQRADLSLTGRYQCEVTTDFPDFIADVKSVYLRVLVYPEKRPEIVVIPNKRHYAVGDFLEANCSSYRSKPAANLTWLINGKRVSSRYPQSPPQEYRYKDAQNMETSRTTMRIEITPQDFIGGKLRLGCLAEIADHYHQSSEIIIEEADRPKISSVVDNSSSTGSGSVTRFRNSGTSAGARVISMFPQSSDSLLTLLLVFSLTYKNLFLQFNLAGQTPKL